MILHYCFNFDVQKNSRRQKSTAVKIKPSVKCEFILFVLSFWEHSVTINSSIVLQYSLILWGIYGGTFPVALLVCGNFVAFIIRTLGKHAMHTACFAGAVVAQVVDVRALLMTNISVTEFNENILGKTQIEIIQLMLFPFSNFMFYIFQKNGVLYQADLKGIN